MLNIVNYIDKYHTVKRIKNEASFWMPRILIWEMLVSLASLFFFAATLVPPPALSAVGAEVCPGRLKGHFKHAVALHAGLAVSL